MNRHYWDSSTQSAVLADGIPEYPETVADGLPVRYYYEQTTTGSIYSVYERIAELELSVMYLTDRGRTYGYELFDEELAILSGELKELKRLYEET